LHIQVGQVQILVDHRGSLLDPLPKDRAARVHGFRSETRAFPATRHLDLQCARHIRLQKHSSIRPRYDDGMIEHGRKNGLKRKLRMQQRCRLKKQSQADKFQLGIASLRANQALGG
jgi:hypothetical protein